MKNTILSIIGVVLIIALVYFLYKTLNKPDAPVIVVEKTPVPRCNVDYLCGANQTCINEVCVTNPTNTVVVERVAYPVVYGRFGGWHGGGGHGGGGHHGGGHH